MEFCCRNTIKSGNLWGVEEFPGRSLFLSGASGSSSPFWVLLQEAVPRRSFRLDLTPTMGGVRSSGARLWAPTPGLAPEWEPSGANAGGVTRSCLFLLTKKVMDRSSSWLTPQDLGRDQVSHGPGPPGILLGSTWDHSSSPTTPPIGPWKQTAETVNNPIQRGVFIFVSNYATNVSLMGGGGHCRGLLDLLKQILIIRDHSPKVSRLWKNSRTNCLLPCGGR